MRRGVSSLSVRTQMDIHVSAALYDAAVRIPSGTDKATANLSIEKASVPSIADKEQIVLEFLRYKDLSDASLERIRQFAQTHVPGAMQKESLLKRIDAY